MKKIIATTTALVFALGLSTAALAQTAGKPATSPSAPAKVMEKEVTVKPAAEPTKMAPATQAPVQEKQEPSQGAKTEKEKKNDQGAKMHKKGDSAPVKAEGGEKKADKEVPAGEKK